MEDKQSRRGAIRIMASLIGLIRPLLGIMFLAVIMGVLGYLCAIFLTILSVEGIVEYIRTSGENWFPIRLWQGNSVNRLATVLLSLAVLRGILHYLEQYCNHYIAFRILAVIRHKVFSALRRLCPAKLEGRQKGNLIAVITSDIELLEVFYAHTISPIAIAFLTSLIMVLFMGYYHPLAGLFAFTAYVTIGVLVPVWNSRRGALPGMEFRNQFGELNSFVLDSLRGLDEIIQYGYGEVRREQLREHSRKLKRLQKEMTVLEAGQRSLSNLLILLFSTGMLFLMQFLYHQRMVGYDGVLLCTVAMMGSFGPVLALGSLSNTLNQTLASGERVLSLLEEEPETQDITGEGPVKFSEVLCQNVGFSYGKEEILKEFSASFQRGEIVGILGPSGCGKSTLLKLLMRFWDVEKGRISISGRDIRQINTSNLRDMEAYMTQETLLFHTSIADNITLGREGVDREAVVSAAKKASVHEFIQSLPEGYDTQVGELGSTLSGGERQRIGIARMFLSDAGLWLLDEPTSNLDSLNERIVLKSIREESRDRAVVIVTHRVSTLDIADRVLKIEKDIK